MAEQSMCGALECTTELTEETESALMIRRLLVNNGRLLSHTERRMLCCSHCTGVSCYVV
jgi:hypothetical protein